MTVWASITVVSSIRGHLVVLAPLVLVVTVVVIARSVPTPRSSTVHRLRAATRCRALLVVVGVRAAVSVVSGTLGVLVVPASPVLVVLGVVEARSIRSPVTRAVNRLRAAGGGTLLVVVGVGATITVVSGALGVLVVPAPVVLVVRTLVVARPVSSPGTHAIHRLGAPRGGALPVVIAVGAARAIVSGVLGDLVRPAALVLGALQGPPVFT